jgi:hypothetical protein
MTLERWHSPMELEKEPLGYLLRSEAAFATLEALQDGRPRSPLEVRRALELHPQTFKEAVDHLNDFALLSLMVPPGSRPRRTARGVAVPLVLRITLEGQEVFELAQGVRKFIQQQAQRRDRHLPAATLERWLPA